jgi:hypothetical protein
MERDLLVILSMARPIFRVPKGGRRGCIFA